MKRITAIILTMALAAVACWFTEEDFNDCYIADVNGFTHYQQDASFYSATYYNGGQVALPLTVTVKVGIRQGDATYVTGAGLAWRVMRDGAWISGWTQVARGSLPASTDYSVPVPLFGRGSVYPRAWRYGSQTYRMQSGDRIYIKYWVTNGVFQSLDWSATLDAVSLQTSETEATYTYGAQGVTPPFICYVVWNGKYRAGM